MNIIQILEAALQKGYGKMEAATNAGAGAGAGWMITRAGRGEGSDSLMHLETFCPGEESTVLVRSSFSANQETLL